MFIHFLTTKSVQCRLIGRHIHIKSSRSILGNEREIGMPCANRREVILKGIQKKSDVNKQVELAMTHV